MGTADIAAYLTFDLNITIGYQVSLDIDVLVDDGALAPVIPRLSCSRNEAANLSSDGPYSIFCYRWHHAPARFGVHSHPHTSLPPPASFLILESKMRHLRCAKQYVEDRFPVGSVTEVALPMNNGFGKAAGPRA